MSDTPQTVNLTINISGEEESITVSREEIFDTIHTILHGVRERTQPKYVRKPKGFFAKLYVKSKEQFVDVCKEQFNSRRDTLTELMSAIHDQETHLALLKECDEEFITNIFKKSYQKEWISREQHISETEKNITANKAEKKQTFNLILLFRACINSDWGAIKTLANSFYEGQYEYMEALDDLHQLENYTPYAQGHTVETAFNGVVIKDTQREKGDKCYLTQMNNQKTRKEIVESIVEVLAYI